MLELKYIKTITAFLNETHRFNDIARNTKRICTFTDINKNYIFSVLGRHYIKNDKIHRLNFLSETIQGRKKKGWYTPGFARYMGIFKVS